MPEIERKFLLKEAPNTPTLSRYASTRYFLSSRPGKEERISQVGDKYFYDCKVVISQTERRGSKKEISESEFNGLKTHSFGCTARNTQLVSKNPRITIHTYMGNLQGFIRVEVEFSSNEEAEAFTPFDWMGQEITGTKLARDASLVKIAPEELRSVLKQYDLRIPSLDRNSKQGL